VGLLALLRRLREVSAGRGGAPLQHCFQVCVCVYYCRTYYKAVCGGGEGDSEGRYDQPRNGGLGCPSRTSVGFQGPQSLARGGLGNDDKLLNLHFDLPGPVATVALIPS
jgi:hypothetical protein